MSASAAFLSPPPQLAAAASPARPVAAAGAARPPARPEAPRADALAGAGVAAAAAGALAAGRQRRRLAQRARAAALRAFRMRQLGASDLVVPDVCLGTMTWGKQNTEAEAHEQLDYAVKERGLKFMDTAEMYPVPTEADTQGRTDRYIGSWLKSSGVDRKELTIATKVCGYNERIAWVRDAGAPTRVTREQVRESVKKSLERLGTDYIDLLQIHWPDRMVPLFGQGLYDEANQREGDTPFEEQLRAFEELHKEGIVRYFGVSNETSFGVMSFLQASERSGLPRIVSIQNSYSLLTRTAYETDLAEVCCKRYGNVGLLAYSPLAGGVLSGKYLVADAEVPAGARLNLFPGFMSRYRNSDSEAATREYVALAERHGLSPTQLALAWCKSRWFVTSSIQLPAANPATVPAEQRSRMEFEFKPRSSSAPCLNWRGP